MIPQSGWRGQRYNGQIERELEVSKVLWCDKNEHPFSAKDPQRQHFTQTQTVPVMTGNSYGHPTYQDRQEVTEELDICGPCWAKQNPFQKDDQPTLQELEARDTGYREGFEAGENHGRYTVDRGE